MVVKFSRTQAFALAAVLWLKSQVSMIHIKFIAFAKYKQVSIEFKENNSVKSQEKIKLQLHNLVYCVL